MLIRGLHEHWARSPQGSDVANLIQAFMLIQVGLNILDISSYSQGFENHLFAIVIFASTIHS